MQLIDLPFKRKATIAKLPTDPLLKCKLMEMGFFVGAEIMAIRPSPLGDPVEYDLEGYRLFIRKKEGQHIELEDREDTSGQNGMGFSRQPQFG